MRIKFVPSDLDAPGCYRCFFPLRQMAKYGHQVSMPDHVMQKRPDGSVGLKVTFDPRKIGDEDVWVIQQPKDRLWVDGGIHQLRSEGKCVIIDCDDNYLELPDWNPAFFGSHPHRHQDGHIVNRAERRATLKRDYQKVTNKANRNHLFTAMQQADGVVVSTPYLAKLYSAYNDNIVVARNYVDWDMWADIVPVYEQEPARLRIGYLGVFSYRKGDLEVIRGVIKPFMERHPEIDFVANSEEVHDYLMVPEGQRVTIGEYDFYPHEGEDYPLPAMTTVLDVGLVPLAPGGMAEGKSHLKGMEYNAAGAPFLSSPSESYDYWTEHLVNGVTCHTPQDWDAYLEHLVTDHKARKEMGRLGREKARRHSIQKNWFSYEAAYTEIVGSKHRRLARGAIKRGAVQKISELENLLITAELRQPRLVVEVGSARGGTFWAFSQIAADDALLVSIDMPGGSPLDVREGKDVYGGRDRDRMRSYVREGQRCVLIDGNSQSLSTVNALVDTIGSQKIDLLFIDADHRYQGVKTDFGLYSPLVRPGGLIAFHDVIPQNDKRSGVHILWRQLKKKHHPAFEWVGTDNWGLGSWGGIGALVAS